MFWIQQKYIGLISNKLNQFKIKNNNTYNFRCPYCGDSRKNPNKARGYLYPRTNGYQYHCHNCGITVGFEKFIKDTDFVVYNDYIREKLENQFSIGQKRELTDVEVFANKMKKPVFMKSAALHGLTKISSLNSHHPAAMYVRSRLIPNKYHYKLFYVSEFKKYVNRLIPNKYSEESLKYDEERLIIPFLDSKKNVFGFQGRALNDNSLRYVTIMLDSNHSKIFGLDTVDFTQPYFILEGPIDSMFVENSIAMAGNTIDWSYVNSNAIFVYDNEPRNSDICRKISQVIDRGHSVVIFPEFITQKDINEIVLKYSSINVNQLLIDSTYKGLKAKLHFTKWCKVSNY